VFDPAYISPEALQNFLTTIPVRAKGSASAIMRRNSVPQPKEQNRESRPKPNCPPGSNPVFCATTPHQLLLREQLGQTRLRFHDDQRRRLAMRQKGLGSKLLREVATIVTPESPLAWHRRLIAQKSDGSGNGDAADRENRRRSRIWCCAWRKKTAIGGIGESRERCPIWIMRSVMERFGPV
jgi:hypothetical protein